jgi:excisionase family DNA binding protein
VGCWPIGRFLATSNGLGHLGENALEAPRWESQGECEATVLKGQPGTSDDPPMDRIVRYNPEPGTGPEALDAVPPGARFLTPREVAEITGLHVAVVRRAVDRGELRAHKLCSRLRIRQEDFQDWLERNIVRP